MDAYEMLSNTLLRQSRQEFQRSTSILLEFGYIREGYGLFIDRFNSEIPKGEYSVDNRLAYDYPAATAIR